MKFKKGLLGALILILAVGLSGCGKSNDSKNLNGISPKDYVYKGEELSFEMEQFRINQTIRVGENIFLQGLRTEEASGAQYAVAMLLNEDGTVKQKSEFQQKENTIYNSITIDSKANIFAIKNEYVMQETVSDKDAEAVTLDAAAETAEGGEYKDDYYLVQLSWEGEEIFSVKLNDLPQIKELTEEDYFYAGGIYIDGKDTLFVNILGKYCQFDNQGNFQKVIIEPDGGTLLEGSTLMLLQNGKTIGIGYDEKGTKLFEVDMSTGSIVKNYDISEASNNYSYYPGIGYDLLLSDYSGIYGYNLESAEKVTLMNYIDSDLGNNSLYGVVAINDNNFFAMYDNTETWVPVLAKFTKVDPKDIKDKAVINLGCSYLDWDIRNAVVTFNKTNENYRISIIDYGFLYNTENDYNAGITKMNTDIASGKVPDIIVVNDSMPIDSYISKGLLENLKPYIEKDSELTFTNYMPNIIEAFSVDSKLYQLVPSYSISTLVGKTSIVGEEKGWTIKEANDILKTRPEGTKLLNDLSREQMLYIYMEVAGSQFIDKKTGKCSFDTQSFLDFLELLKTFPEVVDDTMWRENSYEMYQSQWREDKVLTQMNYISDFRSYNNTEKGMFGEKITMIGYPSESGDGAAIIPNAQFAMSAKSGNKDGVWEFLRYFIGDEYQGKISYWFPLSIKRLEQLGEEAQQKPSYLDENGNKVEYDDLYDLNGVEIIIPPMTKEEVETLKQQLYSFTNVYTLDENLNKIVQEESAAYFNDQKSVQEVASIIQGRAQIYVNENR